MSSPLYSQKSLSSSIHLSVITFSICRWCPINVKGLAQFFSKSVFRRLFLGDELTIRAGIDCILVVPKTCTCGSRLDIDSDIEDALKCRSLVVTYTCPVCAV